MAQKCLGILVVVHYTATWKLEGNEIPIKGNMVFCTNAIWFS